MAKLFRLVKLNDRFDTQVFTFVLPNKILREFSPDVYSKDFVYGFQKWTVSFVKSNKHLGAFLKLLTVSPGMICNVDFCFTMVNNEHFTKNESFIEKGSDFCTDSDTKGRKSFVPLDDLVNRKFMQGNGEFLVELEMRNIVAYLECYVQIPKDYQSKDEYRTKMETPYFGFGLSDWSISLFPNVSNTDSKGNFIVQLQRHTSFDHLCEVRYKIILGDSNTFESGIIHQMLDATGYGEPYVVGSSLFGLSRGKSSLKVKVEMLSVVSVSEVSLPVLSRTRNHVHLYDRDKQAWMLEADTSGKFLSFRLFYSDISHVPRKFTRYVCFNISVIPSQSDQSTTSVPNGPFSRYYVQNDLDEGYLIHTNISIEKLLDPDCEYLSTDEQCLTVHVHWIESHLLISPIYQTLDDVTRLHKHQMMREILALQAENYALEKQLYSYQQSIAKTSSRGRSASEEVRGPDYRF